MGMFVGFVLIWVSLMALVLVYCDSGLFGGLV